MKTKNLLLIAIAVLSLAGCKYDDDAIWDAVRNLEERMITLETWQKKASDEIALLKAITDESDYILSVVPIMDGDTQKGYTITFKKSGAITLLNGQKGDKGDKGDTPLVSLKQEKDGNWYWTLNGSLMTDVSGAPIRANGTNGTNGTPAPTPQLKTGRQLKVDSVAGNWQDDAFYLSVDNGKTWNKVSGDKGDTGDKGDAGTGSSSSIEIIEDDSMYDYVVFKVNGSQIKVPRYDTTLSLVWRDKSAGMIIPKGETISVAYGEFLRFTGEVANGSSLSVSLSVSDGWRLATGSSNNDVDIYAPRKEECKNTPGLVGPIKVTVTVTNSFKEESDKYFFYVVASDFLYCNADNLLDMLKNDSDDRKKNLKVSGTLTAEHMAAIKKVELVGIDLKDATLEGNAIPDNYFSGKTDLTTVMLSDGIKHIGTGAFSGCTSLKEITLPNFLTTIGNNVFSNCTSLESINCWNSSPPKGDPNSSLGENLINLKKICVPKTFVNYYKEADFWKQYASKIEGAPLPQ
ncbi:leucine-rich repeat protein [Parabacteroides goldsteinii]|uniref:leucine-rich repeat protein n=1 Tax=Parabacteroides goldsteinii TaxID=328812 RepID=UPI003219D005